MMQLVSSETSTLFDVIEKAESVEHIIKIIKQIDALKIALESVEKFHEQSILYARLEAEALIKAVQLGGLSKLRSPHKQTAEWLESLNEQEREKYISMCADGLTIDQVYKREVGNNQKIQEKLTALKSYRTSIINDVKENGIVDLTPYKDYVRSSLNSIDRSMAHDIIDGTRNQLLKAGAVGIGEDDLYVMPKPENAEEVKKAILLRFENISNAFESMKAIAKASKIKVEWRSFVPGNEFLKLCNNYWLPHVLIALERLGVISDGEDMMEEISKNDVHKEMALVGKQLKIGKDKYIESRYAALQAERTQEHV